MPYTISCSCGRALQVQEEYVGKQVRCPACQSVLTVPPPPVPTVQPLAFDAPLEFAVEPPRRQAPPPLPAAAPPPRAPSASSTAQARTGSAAGRSSHDIAFHIHGDDLQLVEIELSPDQTVIAEAGAMTYMEEGIQFEAKMGDGSSPNQGFFGKLWAAGKRMVTGESMFMTHFTNHDGRNRRVAFGAPYPGKIIPVDLDQFDGELICQKNAFLCAALGTQIGIKFTKKFGAGLFGGEGFILQQLKGDGLAFLHACGCIIQRDLADGEMLRMDTGCLVAMTIDVDYDIQKAGNLKSMFFGGEGLFLATLTGPGRVWMQSLPFSRLAERVAAGAPGAFGGGKEEGSILGGIGRMIGGN